MAIAADHRLLSTTPPRITAGVAVSLLLHILLLLVLRDRAQGPVERTQTARMTLEVFLPPINPPQTAIHPEPDKQSERHPEPQRRKGQAAPRKETPTAMPPVAITPVPHPPPPAHEPQLHYIDPEAARASVPEILKQLDREKKPRPVDQVAAKPLYGPQEDTRLGRQMAKAGRPDCMNTMQPGGLLAPIFMLAEKKGTGCKW